MEVENVTAVLNVQQNVPNCQKNDIWYTFTTEEVVAKPRNDL